MGIDPGTVVMGYGLVESRGSDITLVHYGAITGKETTEISLRLKQIYLQLDEIMQEFHPDAVAVEQPFVAKNVRSALAIGRAQAIAMLAAANRDIPSFEYSPARIKQRVANYGASSKEQVQEIVRLQLGLTEIPRPADAADALAVAICHLSEVHLSNLIARQEGRR